MRILAIEDNQEKQSELSGLARKVSERAEFVVAADMATAMQELDKVEYDLIVLDLMLPMVKNGAAVDVGGELLSLIAGSSRNRFANMVALTAYQDLFEKRKEAFAAAGVLLIQYTMGDSSWKTSIASLMRRSSARSRCAFLIVCALELERTALAESRATVGDSAIVNGLDTRKVEIGEFSGRAIVLPRSGLVNAACITAAAIERFRPRLVAMSGICAGIRGKAALGQVLVCETCWEYQVGKYVEGKFQFEPYQTVILESTRQQLVLLCRSEGVLEAIHSGVDVEGLERRGPKMATMVSGSAVIADDRVRDAICEQHRNIDGVEMELSAVFRAARLLDESIIIMGAKAVSDFADSKKDNSFQSIAAVSAARFVVEAIETALMKKK